MKTARLVAVVALVLAGCASGPDFRRPVGPQEARYTAEVLQVESSKPGAASAQRVVPGAELTRAWWQLFESPAVDEVVQRALAGNRTLIAAAATLEQAQEQAAAQAGTLAPQIGLNASSGRDKYGEAFLGTFAPPPPFNFFAVGPTVSYTLDYTGGAARSVEQQYALAEYQRQQLGAAHLAVSGNAVMQLLHVASAQAQIATVQAVLEQDRENLQLVNQAFDAGSVSRLDIVSAESQLASDATRLPPLRQELSVAQHALAVLLGEPPGSAKLPAIELAQLTLPAEIPLSLPSELAHRRPDILAAEAQLHAATAAVGVATANLYPHISLNANAAVQAAVPSRLFDGSAGAFGIVGSIVAPLFDGGTSRAQKRAAVDAMRASAANYEQTVLTAFGQVADSLLALDHDAEQLEAQARAQSAAQENVDLTRKSYHEGNVGVLQVLDAERLYQQARLGYVRAQAQRYLDTAQLFLALGGSAPVTPRNTADINVQNPVRTVAR